jgi:heme-degrading monooxygenase HmoA
LYARNVTFHIKANSHSDYTHTFENQILPLLQKQKGFKEVITLSNAGSPDVVSISLWETKSNSDDYNTRAYPEALKILAKVIEGTPRVQTFESAVSTVHNVHATV